MKLFEKHGLEPIEKCYNCGKKTEENEWFDAIAPKRKLLGLEIKNAKQFKCSKCGHVMSVGALK